jgi:hypothetical protein
MQNVCGVILLVLFGAMKVMFKKTLGSICVIDIWMYVPKNVLSQTNLTDW